MTDPITRLPVRAIRGVSKYDDFFDNCTYFNRKYFKNGKAAEILKQAGARVLDIEDLADSIKFTSVLFIAQQLGHFDVDWDLLFSFPIKNIFALLQITYKEIKEDFPDAVKIWDDKLLQSNGRER